MTDLRTQMAAATETALGSILDPAAAILTALDDVLDPDLAVEAQHVRITLSHFRTKASGWLAAREMVGEPSEP